MLRSVCSLAPALASSPPRLCLVTTWHLPTPHPCSLRTLHTSRPSDLAPLVPKAMKPCVRLAYSPDARRLRNPKRTPSSSAPLAASVSAMPMPRHGPSAAPRPA